MAKLRAVTFDLDGLMFNTEELYIDVGTELLRRRNRVFTKELLDQMMGRPSRISLEIMITHHGLTETVEEILVESDEIFQGILRERLALQPGLRELLAALSAAGIPKGIATSSRRPYVDYVLSRFDLGPQFAFILSAEDVTEGKPHPEIYMKAAGRHGVAPGEMLVLEDSENGCRAAVASGAYTVAVPGPHNAGHDYAGVQLIATSLSDPRIYAALGIEPSSL
jgi:HAD superfamily hydrolase (TIGR01509 family)